MLDRSIKPKPSGKISFNLPKIHNFTINNSLKVYFIKKETLPIIQLKLLIPSGSIYDPLSKHGLSSLTSMLLDEGAGNLNGIDISNAIEKLGSIINISPNKEYTTISLLTLKENIQKSLELFSLIIQSPNFNESDFQREKQKLLTQIVQLNDDPSYIASTEFNKIIYNSTQYQFPVNGMHNSVDTIINDNVKKFYSKMFHPRKSVLVVVGNLTESEVENYVRSFFQNWGNGTQRNTFNITVRKTKKQIILIDKPNAAQTEIRMGQFSKGRTSNNFYDRTILNSILGGEFSSRINLNLREDKGYTYGAHSSYSYNNIGSTFVVSTSVNSENTSDAIKEIFKELENIKTTITQEEIDFSKSSLIRRYPSLFETYSQVAANLALLPIFNLGNNYFENYIGRIENVSLEGVLKAANNNINIDEFVTLVVGNKEIIEPDLRQLSELSNTDLKIIDYRSLVG